MRHETGEQPPPGVEASGAADGAGGRPPSDGVRLAAARAGVDPGGALVVDARTGEDRGGLPASRLVDAWRRRRHLIVECSPELEPSEVSERLAEAGVPEQSPAMAAAGLGTDRERLLYGSVADLGTQGFGGDVLVVVPHPAGLPMDFAWPPTAAPAEGRRR